MPECMPIPAGTLLTGSGAPHAGKRIGLIAETHGEGVDTAVRDAVEACAAHLSSLGATVEEVQPYAICLAVADDHCMMF